MDLREAFRRMLLAESDISDVQVEEVPVLPHTQLLDMPSASNADHDGRYLRLTGGTLSGDLNMGDNSILNSGDIVMTSSRTLYVTQAAVNYVYIWFPAVALIVFGYCHMLIPTAAKYVGVSSTGPRFVFDDGVNPDEVNIYCDEFDLSLAAMDNVGNLDQVAGRRADLSVGELGLPTPGVTPASPVEGMIFWRSSDNTLWVRTSNPAPGWRQIDTTAGTP